MSSANQRIVFPCGIEMKNRFMLAPMTNQQSHKDGTLSNNELKWLSMRAKGQFGMVMTCASHVQAIGQGFPGQLGIFSNKHIEGHKKITKALKEHGSLAVIQLHHAGMRSPKELIGESPVCPSDNEKLGARALTLAEISTLKDDFIKAANRAQESGYDGIEIHGAHGYIISQFLSAEINHRIDEYGGSLENRARLLVQIIEGIRNTCGSKFLVGVRLSPERFGMDLLEIKSLSQQLINSKMIDFLDISLWDVFKFPEDEKQQEKSLLAHFTELNYNDVLITVAGKIRTGDDVQKVLNQDVDFVSIGRSGILHHDFPEKVMGDPNFVPVENPVSEAHLKNEGLSQTFVEYMKKWPGFVQNNQ